MSKKRYTYEQKSRYVAQFLDKIKTINKSDAAHELGIAHESMKSWLHQIDSDEYKRIYGELIPGYISVRKSKNKKKRQEDQLSFREAPRPKPQMITIEPPTFDDHKKKMIIMTLHNCIQLLKSMIEIME